MDDTRVEAGTNRTDVRAGSADIRADSADIRAGSSDVRAGSSDVRAGSSDVRAAGVIDVRAESADIQGDLTHVRIESSPVGPVVRPPEPTDLVVLYVHGDRHLSGTPESALDLAERLALRTGAVVVCPRYRTSFPAALDDIHAVYGSCQARGPVAVAGERLGAGLAAALLVRLRDMGAPPPCCGVLSSALLDLTLEAPSLLLNAAADPTFDVDELRLRAAAYAAGTDPTNPLLSPLHANLHGLPPIQLLAAGTDPLLDDSLEFAARAARSGVTVDLRVRQDTASLRPEVVTAMADFIQAWSPAGQPPHPA
ncbi:MULTISPECIES: alpha/beta hydrolase fold domain-containing protein [unclassified Streptomyces]|uniref:alpha/beta hydrolase fold domain-containing protein n=1 Tax=unclassified Streptomyces TaxID=2593676 RepID=UPI002E8188A7|nr:alpha/beta hydrolase fold domain-containing protein [Streptomyces sp. NBC_00589]WTI35645.1 alpha/beta hydrolase [Streptomyces sp. NBC_00775]WUB30681.1 alpha/beta hydrolase [Streptomyces sp. NBC_00589]